MGVVPGAGDWVLVMASFAIGSPSWSNHFECDIMGLVAGGFTSL